jgi:hypothetical protein
MNGFECGNCEVSPCICEEKKRRENIITGKEALDALYEEFICVPSWRLKLCLWIFPGLCRISNCLREYRKQHK